jgi:GDP-L-fucose synthase
MSPAWAISINSMNISMDTPIYVAGHRGMVGSAIWRELQNQGFHRLIGRTRAELDLRNQTAVRAFFDEEKPACVILAAARVGGIHANNIQPVEFLLENLQIQNNIISEAARCGARKLLFLGSSCIYPKLAAQPMTEDCLLTGPLEPTNQWYALAKIAGLKLCQAYRLEYGCHFISAMPTNLYGPNDNYDLESSHVLPALIRKFHEAKVQRQSSVTCWGTGQPFREFLYVDDLARACCFLLQHYDEPEWINVGSGSEIAIRDLAELVRRVIGFTGQIVWDNSKPDGAPRKLLDSTRLLGLGWRPLVDLATGIGLAYEDYQRQLRQEP